MITPPPIPSEASADPPTILPLTELGKADRQWTLTLHPTHFVLAESSQAQPFVIFREQMMKLAVLAESVPALVVNEPRKLTFKLTPEATATLAEWVGKPVLAANYLRNRYAWVFPIALLWILGSLPLSGNSSAEIDPIPFDPIGLVLGLALVAAWACAKWRPHPVLFLVDSVWFLVLSGHLILEVVNGRSKGWLILVFLLLWMVITGLKHFSRFRGTTITRNHPRG